MATLFRYAVWAKDGKEKWKLSSDEELEKGAVPTFTTVLEVDTDVDALKKSGTDPVEAVKYYGPMYFDLDNDQDQDPMEARAAVLKNSCRLLDKLHSDLGIPTEFIHCWLSGKKGVHITVEPQVFGVERATKRLPWVWKHIATELYVPDLDMGIYSVSSGRMWRKENVKRKEGTYKVPVTFEELKEMTVERYGELVSEPRPNFVRAYPNKKVNYLEASKLGAAAKAEAESQYKDHKAAMKESANQDFAQWPEVPGCIEVLITEGDCDDSNWNQAALQLASWIAARFAVSEKEVYQEKLVTPFLQNVTSASRSPSERKTQFEAALRRARSGAVPVHFGAIIKTTGTACGNCPICRKSLRPREGKDDLYQGESEEGERTFYAKWGIRKTPHGYVASQGKDQVQPLTNFTFEVTDQVTLLQTDSDGAMVEGPRTQLIGTLRDSSGNVINNFAFPEEAWKTRSAFMSTIQGYGNCTAFMTDGDIPKLFEAVLYFSNLLESKEDLMANRTVDTDVCGIIFERPDGMDGPIIPHYVEKSGSVRGRKDDYARTMASRYRYRGDARYSPKILSYTYPLQGDTELEQALDALMSMNLPEKLARVIGWAAATHLREHFHAGTSQFPLLNVWGGASAGKSTTVVLAMMIAGYDFREPNQEPLNMQLVNSPVPLLHYLSTSTTVPRMLEEYNQGGEGGMSAKLYGQSMGFLMASWDRTVAPRGRLEKGGRGGSGVDNIRITAPIVFCSENRPTRAAMRNRTVECLLSPRSREDQQYVEAHARADRLRRHLLRAAKVLLHRALLTDPRQFSFDYMEQNFGHFVPKNMDTRPRFGLMVIFAGLCFLRDTLREDGGVNVDAKVNTLIEALQRDIEVNEVAMEREKRTSEVSKMVMDLNRMAKEGSLLEDTHYYRVGNTLHLDLDMILTPYRIHCRKVGTMSLFTDAGSLSELLQQEHYFMRTQVEDGRKLHLIDANKAAEQGVHCNGFKNSVEA